MKITFKDFAFSMPASNKSYPVQQKGAFDFKLQKDETRVFYDAQEATQHLINNS